MKKKLICLLLVLTASVLTACGDIGALGPGRSGVGGDGEASGNLTVLALDAGYGLEWMREAADLYMVTNKKVKITVKTTVETLAEVAKVEAGNIYIGDVFYANTTLVKAGENGYSLPLDDVYDSKPHGEDKTVAEKVGDSLRSAFRGGSGKTFSLPIFDAFSGILYSETTLNEILGAGNWSLPRTSDEFYAMCQTLKTENSVPIVYSASGDQDYAQNLLSYWFAQYMGQEALLQSKDFKFWDAASQSYVTDTSGDMTVNLPARAKAIEECARFLSVADGMAPVSTKYMDFIKAQVYFWGLGYGTDKRKAGFTLNGDWMYQEMDYLHAPYPRSIKFMRMPIISAIRDLCPSIGSDPELSALIAAIDGGQAGLSGSGYDVSQADYDRVFEARKMVLTAPFYQTLSIPGSARNVGAAKDFLRFMATDAVCEIISSCLSGDVSPYNRSISDPTVLNGFIASKLEIMQDPGLITMPFPKYYGNSAIDNWSGFVGFSDKAYNGQLVTYFNNTYKSSYRAIYVNFLTTTGILPA
ncbi:MAG: extracellular solute-binding protein [Clostridiales bacterium]|jgi:ABC-type glycerol-3-phosphate transport system substrate-binding protein|nr:extracellular solute-binding protein [Clostridiales bacterium]